MRLTGFRLLWRTINQLQMQHYILGIDIGTGSTKAVAMDITGNVLHIAQHYYPISQPKPGYSEQDPDTIHQAFVSCVRDTIQKLETAPSAISFSSAMHSLIPVNQNGQVLSPMLTWADTRAEQIAQRIKASPQAENIYRVTGTPIHPMSPLCKLIWLRENEPGLFGQTHKFISIKEYIWYKLFNVFQVDYSIASGTGLFDILKLQWSQGACILAGVSSAQLSSAVDTSHTQTGINANVAVQLGIPILTPFIIGATDGCCANLGSHVTSTGIAALTIGTSGAVRTTGSTPVYNYAGMTFNYLLNHNTYISGGAVNNGGIAVNWLLKTFLNKTELSPADYTTLSKAIQTTPTTSEGLIFLPYLYGERAPIWDAKSSGAYLNIKPQHTQAHFLRAALEGICYALYDVLLTLESASAPINQLNISGGFLTSPVWIQLLADVTGKQLMILQPEDASAIGAIYLAMQALYPQQTLPQPGEPQLIYPNQANHILYAKNFPLFKQLYNNVKGTINQLNNL